MHAVLPEILLFTALSVVAMARVSAVPVDKEPVHHLVFANEYTRVYSVEVPVGKQTLLHEHKYDYVFVNLDNAQIENIPEGKPASRLQLKPGEVRFSKAPLVHIAKNVGTTPFRNITISILKPGDAGDTETAMSQIGGASVEMLSNSKMTARTVTIGPNGSSTIATYHPHLLIAVSDVTFSSSGSAALPLGAGQVKWFGSAVTHQVVNRASTSAKFVIIEFK